MIIRQNHSQVESRSTPDFSKPGLGKIEMPQDADLYGRRPAKKQKRATPLSTSLDFTAQLTSLISNASTAGPAKGQPRKPSQEAKKDVFHTNVDSKASKPRTARDDGPKLIIKEVTGTEEEAQELARARRKMENKARLYVAMKRGDYVPRENEAEPLVDFDRKWTESSENHGMGSSSNSSSSDGDDEEADTEVIEWDDEFGRRRQGTRADKERMERRERRGLLGAEELERMSARPVAPSKLIYGDAVQTMAFNPEAPEKMEELARKRDRSATPPEMRRYDADKEIRTKGVGFYKFSRDEGARAQEMKSLDEERQRTEQQRQAREGQKDARRRDMEQRRRDMQARRAQRQADNFLDGMLGGTAS